MKGESSKLLPKLVALVAPLSLFGQSPPLQTINSTDLVSSGPTKINYNDTYLFNNKPTRFSGTGAPGLITYSVLGDLYFRTSNSTVYACFSVSCSTGSPTWSPVGVVLYPGAGIANSTGTAWGTSYSTTGTGTTVVLSTAPVLTLPNATGLPVATGISGLGSGVATALAAGVSGSGVICLVSGSTCAVYPGAGIPLSTGSGWGASYTITTLTAALNPFGSTSQGVVAASGGGTSNFLRADGVWAPPPSSGGSGATISINGGSLNPVSPSVLNFIPSSGIVMSGSQPTTTAAVNVGIDTAVVATRAAVQSGALGGCTVTSSGTATVTCTGNPTISALSATPSQPLTLLANFTSIQTINPDGTGALNAYLSNGITTPVPTTSGQIYNFQYNSGLNGWQCVSANCAAGSLGITVGSTTIASGTNGRVEYNNSGVLGELPVQGTDSKILSAGTFSGTAAPLCSDANGGATTSGCTPLTMIEDWGSPFGPNSAYTPWYLNNPTSELAPQCQAASLQDLCATNWNAVGGSSYVVAHGVLSKNWTSGTVAISIMFAGNGSGNAVHHTLQFICLTPGGTPAAPLVYNTLQNFPTQTTSGSAIYVQTLNATTTGCSAGYPFNVRIARADSNAGAELYKVWGEISIP